MSLKISRFAATKSFSLRKLDVFFLGRVIPETSPHQTRLFNSGPFPSNRYLIKVNKKNPYLTLSEEVRAALEEKKPVVALETAIYTHGKPFPFHIQD